MKSVWIHKLLESPRTIGAIAPSSKALAQAMTRPLQITDHVLEIGSGNGVVSQAILQCGIPSHQVTLVELDEDLANQCRIQFPDCAVHCHDVEVFLSSCNTQFDHILSGIPFALMEPDKRRRIFSLIIQHLKPTGSFILFQYTPVLHAELKSHFQRIELEPVLRNLPPAIVYQAIGPIPEKVTS